MCKECSKLNQKYMDKMKEVEALRVQLIKYSNDYSMIAEKLWDIAHTK